MQWLSADAAAHRLGVKIGTLYSYVSRGVIRSHPLSEGRGSRFDRAEVEGLLTRRRSQPGGGADTIVASRITRLHEDGVRYRGHPVEDLARGRNFYEHQAEGVGGYFLDALLSDIDSLALYAGTHRQVFGYFRLLAKRFPHAIYYRVELDSAVVWRVLDCRRDPAWIRTQFKRD